MLYFVKNFPLKIAKPQCLCGFFRLWSYYTISLHSSNNASCFHISFSFSAADKAPLCKGGWQKSLISDWGIVLVDILQSLRHGLRRATSLYTREAFTPTIILQITLRVCMLMSIIRLKFFVDIYCYTAHHINEGHLSCWEAPVVLRSDTGKRNVFHCLSFPKYKAR